MYWHHTFKRKTLCRQVLKISYCVTTWGPSVLYEATVLQGTEAGPQAAMKNWSRPHWGCSTPVLSNWWGYKMGVRKWQGPRPRWVARKHVPFWKGDGFSFTFLPKFLSISSTAHTKAHRCTKWMLQVMGKHNFVAKWWDPKKLIFFSTKLTMYFLPKLSFPYKQIQTWPSEEAWGPEFLPLSLHHPTPKLGRRTQVKQSSCPEAAQPPPGFAESYGDTGTMWSLCPSWKHHVPKWVFFGEGYWRVQNKGKEKNFICFSLQNSDILQADQFLNFVQSRWVVFKTNL